MTEPTLDVAVVDDRETLDAITRAEVDSAITTAKRHPRDLATFRDNIMTLATWDEETAQSCIYSIRRRGGTLAGPSVRLAELLVSQYGNVRAGARITGESVDGRYITAMGVCHDLENNVYVAMEVRRRITDRTGARMSDDMVGVTANAAASVAFRNAVFRAVPRTLWEPAYRAARECALGDMESLVERRERVVHRLGELNPQITPTRILHAVARNSIDDLTREDLEHLIGLGTAIKDGVQTVEEAFPPPQRGSGTGSVTTDELAGTTDD